MMIRILMNLSVHLIGSFNISGLGFLHFSAAAGPGLVPAAPGVRFDPKGISVLIPTGEIQCGRARHHF